jgi:hypothetical protein
MTMSQKTGLSSTTKQFLVSPIANGGGGFWGDRSHFQSPAALARPFIDHLAIDTQPIAPADIPSIDHEDEFSNDEGSEDSQIAPDQMPSMTHRKPATAMEELDLTGLTSEEISTVHRWFIEADDIQRSTRHEQIREVATQRRGMTPKVSFSRIAAVFHVQKGIISNHLSDVGWSGQTPGRPTAISETQLVAVCEFIGAQFDAKRPASYFEIVSYIGEEFGIHLPIDSIRHIIRGLPQFKVIQGIPTDARRLESNPVEIDQYYDALDS